MNLYTATAIRPKGSKPLEHVEFLLDGTPDYPWRDINNEIKNSQVPLSIPEVLPFRTKDLKFEELDQYCWLRTSLTMPLLNNKLIDHLTKLHEYEFKSIPAEIQNSKNINEVNSGFSAFYIHEYFDCIDFDNSKPIRRGEIDSYEYNHINFLDLENYPPLFKIKGVATPFMHFTTEKGINQINSLGLKGAEFKKT